jgi:CysZ protein
LPNVTIKTSGGGVLGVGVAFAAPFRGIGTIMARPRLWPLAATPTVLLIAAIAGGGVAARHVYDAAARALARAMGSSWIGVASAAASRWLIGLALALAVLLIATLVVPPVSAPFMDALAARVDARREVDEPLLRRVVRSVRVALVGLVLVLVPQGLFWVLSLAVPALAPVWAALGLAVAALGLAYDALDWALARRGLGVRARLRWMWTHRGRAAGLGLATWVIALVPGLQIVLLPAIVIGGVAVVNAAER